MNISSSVEMPFSSQTHISKNVQERGERILEESSMGLPMHISYSHVSSDFHLTSSMGSILHILMFKTHSDAIVYYVGAWMMLNIADSDLTATVIMKVPQSFWNQKQVPLQALLHRLLFLS